MHTLNIDPWFVNRAKQSRAGRLNAYDTLDARKTALVVVDMQNYFVTDGMPGCAPEARTIVPNINRLAQATRTAGGTVIWIQTEALIASWRLAQSCGSAMRAAVWIQITSPPVARMARAKRLILGTIVRASGAQAGMPSATK